MQKKQPKDSKDIIQQTEVFFKQRKKNIPKEITVEDEKAKEELDSLFDYNGNLKDISEWLQHEEFRLKKANSDSERKLREKNATLAFRFSSVWAVFIAFIILSKGFAIDFFTLNQVEFLFVIGTLTTSIFAFYLLVLKYLFYRKDSDKEV